MTHSNHADNEPKLCSIYSSDANYQAGNLTDWDQEFDQVSEGHFWGTIDEIRFTGIHVFRETTNRRLRQQCRVNNSGLWLGFSSDNKSCIINNRQAESHQFLCMPSGQDFELLTPDDFSIFGIVLQPDQLTGLGCDLDEWLGCCDHALGIEQPSGNQIIDFRNYLSLLLGTPHHTWRAHTHQLIIRDAVFDLLSQNSPQAASKSYTSLAKRQKIIGRIKQYLADSHLTAPITVSEICNATHISRRNLQQLFTTYYGISPKRYIQMLRLNQVRRALMQRQVDQTVAEIAFQFGFFHLGQFSHDYKRLFGELPSDTRRYHG